MTPEKHDASRLGSLIKGHTGDRQIFTTQNHPNSFVSDDELRTFHHYFQKDYLARTFHEPLKGQEKSGHSQMIYTAVMSAIKATLFHYGDSHIRDRLRIYYPIIVFGGELYEAYVDKNKETTLNKAQHIQLSFHYMALRTSPNRSIWDYYHQFIVDIIQENHLSTFLQEIEQEHIALSQLLEQKFKA